MSTLNERKTEFLKLYEYDLKESLPNDPQTKKDIDDLISLFSVLNLDEYVTRSFVDVIGDAMDDQALTPATLRRYLNALHAAVKNDVGELDGQMIDRDKVAQLKEN